MEQGGDQNHVLPGVGGVQLKESVGGEALLSAALFSAIIFVTIRSSMPREDILISRKLIPATEKHAKRIIPLSMSVPCQ